MNSKLSLFAVLALSASLSHAATLPKESGSFDFTVPQTGKKMEVFSYQPPGANANTPVVFVLTGLNRNAAEYRDSWVENAKKNKLIVIAPLFSEADYPGNDGYNLGILRMPKPIRSILKGNGPSRSLTICLPICKNKGSPNNKTIIYLATALAASLFTGC